MAQSLKNLSLMATARTLWDDHEIAQLYQPALVDLSYRRKFGESQPVAEKIRRQVDNFQLPALLNIDLKLAIVEVAKRNLAKECTKAKLRLETEPRPSSCDEALRECLPKYLRDHPLRAPRGLRWHFAQRHQCRMVVDFFFALVMPNPRDDANPLRACWTSPEFVPIQSIFLDNFPDIWSTLLRDLWAQDVDDNRQKAQREAVRSVFLQLGLTDFSNATIPWFVFELLDREQRDKFLALLEVTLTASRSSLVVFFVNIFSHWPWQDRAFDECFAGKKELGDNDKYVLKNVLMRKYCDEKEALRAELLPRKASFYVKVKNFLDAKNVPT